MDDETQLARHRRARIDRSEILDCLERCTHGIDRMDRELARSAYHDGAINVHGDVSMTVDVFIDWAFAQHADQVLHQHHITNYRLDLEGDAAHSETYYLFAGRYSEQHDALVIAGGRYIDRFERRDARWAIAARVCTLDWLTRPASIGRDEPGDADALIEPFTIANDAAGVSSLHPLAVRHERQR
jgi:hypothetical protein